MALRSEYFYVTVVGLAIILTGCGGTEGPTTPIVKEVEAAGSGQVASASPQALRHWFSQHRSFASHITSECASAAGRNALNYADTTEAKVCAAAFDMQIQKAGRDGKAF